MRCEQHAHDWPCRRKLDLPTIVEGATGPGFRVNSYLIRWELQALLMERVRHHDDLPKPGRRTRRVCWVHLDLDDRISHLPLLPFALVFSQEDTFLPFLLVFQGFLPPLAHSLRIPWATGMSMEQYLLVYQSHRRELHQQLRGWDYPRPVATAWLLSFARVEQRNPAAAELLRLCAFLTSDAIPEELLAQNAAYLGPVLEQVVPDPFLLAQAVDALRAFSLINRDPKKKTLSVHPLVQAVLQDSMDESEKDHWTTCAIQIASSTLDERHTRIMQPIVYHSCFISYSSKDEMLARRLHADLQDQGVRCWYAPEDLKIGDKIRSQIDEAIHLQDKLLLLLSEHSIESDWVEMEVESAIEKERSQQRGVLFPVRLDESVMQTTRPWVATLRRTRHIGDFSQWADPQAYQIAFDRLLRDMKKA